MVVRTRSQGLIGTLLLQFLLGMAVNLIGTPMQNSGAARIASELLLALHLLLGIGMIAFGILAVVYAGRVGPPLAGPAWTGLVVLVVTFAAGVLATVTGSGWWSYLMAAGATALFLVYGVLFLRADRRRTQPAG